MKAISIPMGEKAKEVIQETLQTEQEKINEMIRKQKEDNQ